MRRNLISRALAWSIGTAMVASVLVTADPRPAAAETVSFTLNAELLSPTSVTISWAPVQLPENDPVVYYFVYIPEGVAFSPGTSPRTFTGLTPGATYTFKVDASGSTHYGLGRVTVTMPPSGVEPPPPPVPPAPTINIRSIRATYATYNFHDPILSPELAVVRYEARRTPGGTIWSHFSPQAAGASYLLDGLASDTTYLLEIRAIGTNGPGPWGAATFKTPPQPPDAPVLTHVVPNETGVFLRWDPPAPNDSTITGYDIIINETGTGVRASTVWISASAGGIGGLKSDTDYQLFVRATSTAGAGPDVRATFRTLGGNPPPPPPPPPPVEPDPEPNCRQAPVNPAFETGDPVRASIYRLYCSYFLRYPDLGGFAFWHSSHATGAWEMIHISNYFSVSPEFVATYGSLDDAEFVDLIYRNIMERASEPEGRAFWIQELASNRWTRGSVMLFFSQSPEFRTKTGTS